MIVFADADAYVSDVRAGGGSVITGSVLTCFAQYPHAFGRAMAVRRQHFRL